jgi:hypothetical protein
MDGASAGVEPSPLERLHPRGDPYWLNTLQGGQVRAPKITDDPRSLHNRGRHSRPDNPSPVLTAEVKVFPRFTLQNLDYLQAAGYGERPETPVVWRLQGRPRARHLPRDEAGPHPPDESVSPTRASPSGTLGSARRAMRLEVHPRAPLARSATWPASDSSVTLRLPYEANQDPCGLNGDSPIGLFRTRLPTVPDYHVYAKAITTRRLGRRGLRWRSSACRRIRWSSRCD